MKNHPASFLIFVAIGCVTGCPKVEENGRQESGVKPTMTMTYTVGRLQDGQFVSMGTINFDEKNKGTLSLDSEGPAADELREAWSGIADEDVIHVRRSETSEDEDGETVSEFFGVDVARTSEEFPSALMEHLSHEYGFFATPVPGAE